MKKKLSVLFLSVFLFFSSQTIIHGQYEIIGGKESHNFGQYRVYIACDSQVIDHYPDYHVSCYGFEDRGGEFDVTVHSIKSIKPVTGGFEYTIDMTLHLTGDDERLIKKIVLR